MNWNRYEQLHQLAFMPTLFPVNVYLVEEQEELTLVDAGMPFCVKGILRTANQIGKPITRILLTHAHDDHIGGLERVKEALPGVKIHISERDACLLRGDKSLRPGEPQSKVRGGVPKPNHMQVKPDVLLQEGDLIGSLEAIATPGHTPGHMAFLDRRSGAILAGDAFQVRGGLAVSGELMPLFPFPALATWDSQTAIASARKLLARAPQLLAVGHGRLLEQPCEAMERVIQRAEASLAKRMKAVNG